jgi:hypothetical protein
MDGLTSLKQNCEISSSLLFSFKTKNFDKRGVNTILYYYAHLQIICRLLNKFLKVGDLEGVVFYFYMLWDLDVSPETETATVLDRSGRFVE